MRIDNSNFTVANKSANKEPIIVVEVAFDSANTDVYYFCTHSVDGLSGANVVNDCVKGVSGTSQKLNPDKALSTIGSMSFDALDIGLTDLQKSKLNSDLGLKGKRVRFYIGDNSLSWSDYILAQTQIVESVDYKDNVYSFKCADVQRQMRKDIFELKKTAISSSLSAGSATINVYKTSGFELVKQPASPSGITDAPGQKVGYLTLSNGCIVRYTGKTSASFTGCTWGVFDTKHLIEDIEKPSDAGADNAPSVTEFVYLEMPAVMLAYALLTGSLYNDPGEFLPDHWHLGIDGQYIRTADFINIGNDWWELGDNDDGVPAVVKGVKKTDGKKFIEEQLYMMLGAFSPVYANGELGLKRMTVIPSQGGYVRELTVDNIVSYGSLTHDMKSVINFAVLDWNYVIGQDRYTRKNIMPDTLSIARHGQSDTKELKFKTLETSRHSYSTIKSRFDSLRDRYAGPPLRITLQLLPSQNDLEVGDIVRVNLEHVKDYTGEEIDGSLDRNFEIQQVSTDWVSGKVSVTLFGSSQNATVLLPEEPGTAITNDWYNSAGTEINAANFPGQLTESSGVTHITGTIDLTGHASLLHSNAIYYCTQDLTNDAGGTIIINNNTQIRVRGFFQNNGTIDGKGRGLPGGVGTANVSSASNSGKKGFLGSTISQDGISDVATYYIKRNKNTVIVFDNSWVKSQNNRLSAINGYNQSAPILNLSTTETSLKGIPSDLRGCSGSAGGSLLQRDLGYSTTDREGGTYEKPAAPDQWHAGGNGGAGGAGLLIVCRGMDMGASAKIDLSGINGTVTTPIPALTNRRQVFAGCGGGGYTGACYIILDGTTSTAPTLNNSNAVAEVGRCPVPSNAYNVVSNFGAQGNDYGPLDANFGSANLGAQRSRVNTYESNFRIQYLTGFIESTPDTPTFSDQPLSIALSEATNTPPSAAGNFSSVDVTVTPPADDNYSYSKIYYRVQGDAGWSYVGAASPETSFTVASDGKTFEVLARSVSKTGNESRSGITDSITVVDVINAPLDSELDSVIPLYGVTALELQDYAGTVFAGKDAKFKWNNANAILGHFLHYKIEVVDTGANTVRTETSIDPFYVYTYEKNKEDYKNQNATEGAHRQFTVRVTPISRNKNNLDELREGGSDSLTVSNAAPGLPTALSIVPGYKLFSIFAVNPTDLDYLGIKVYASTSTGFIPSVFNEVAQSAGFPISISQLNDGTPIAGGETYYVRIIPHDELGAGSQSSEFSVTTLGVPAMTEVPVNETLTVNGRIIANADTDPYSVILGPHSINSKVSLFAFENNGSPLVAMYEDGTAEFTGKVTVTAGSNVEVGATNTTNTNQLTDGAGLGDTANWSGIASMPARFLDTPAVGLNLTATYMGYYDGTNWTAVVDNAGNLSVGGAAFGSEGAQIQANSGNPRSYIGDGDEKYLKFEGGELEIGPKTKFKSVDTYNKNGATFMHFLFPTMAIPSSNVNNYVNGNSSVSVTAGPGSVAGYYQGRYFSAIGLNEDRMQFNTHVIHLKTVIRPFGAVNYGNTSTIFFGVGEAYPSSSYGNAMFKLTPDMKILAIARNGNTGLSSSIDTGVSWIDNGYFKLEIVHTPGTSVKFYVDDVLRVTISDPDYVPAHNNVIDFQYLIENTTGSVPAALYWNHAKLMYYTP